MRRLTEKWTKAETVGKRFLLEAGTQKVGVGTGLVPTDLGKTFRAAHRIAAEMKGDEA